MTASGPDIQDDAGNKGVVTNEREGVFDLRSWKDLLRKVEHDLERVKANPVDSYAAFDFVVTAWHLLEWRHGPTYAHDVKKLHPILEVCEHLALGAKHFRPSKKTDVLRASGRRPGAWAEGAFAPGAWAHGAWHIERLEVSLDGSAATLHGTSIDALQLADAVWSTLLALGIAAAKK